MIFDHRSAAHQSRSTHFASSNQTLGWPYTRPMTIAQDLAVAGNRSPLRSSIFGTREIADLFLNDLVRLVARHARRTHPRDVGGPMQPAHRDTPAGASPARRPRICASSEGTWPDALACLTPSSPSMWVIASMFRTTSPHAKGGTGDCEAWGGWRARNPESIASASAHPLLRRHLWAQTRLLAGFGG